MGLFSWLDCKDPKKNIKFGVQKNVYVLVPEQYVDVFGNHIVESCYDGYGHFGGYDIYDIVAEWNKEDLSEELLEKAPTIDNFGGLYDFEKENLRHQGKTEAEIDALELAQKTESCERAFERRQKLINSMNDYKAGMSADDMDEKYGDEWKREIGIAIACGDEKNALLTYPIKITYDETAIYEYCSSSDSDPDQGY